VVLIRHGESEANVAPTADKRSPRLIDCRLTPKGEQEATEAAALYNTASDLHSRTPLAGGFPRPDRIYVSPLTRALQTATLLFDRVFQEGDGVRGGPPAVRARTRFIALEEVREGNNLMTENHRRPAEALQPEFRHVDFSRCPLGQPPGAEHCADLKDEIEVVRERARGFLAFLEAEHRDECDGKRARPAADGGLECEQCREIAVVCHSGFMRCVAAVVTGLNRHHSFPCPPNLGCLELWLEAAPTGELYWSLPKPRGVDWVVPLPLP